MAASEPTTNEDEGTFSIHNNLHVYYQIKDPDLLLHALKGYFQEQILLPANERSFKSSDNIVYMVGLVLRSNASIVHDLYKAYVEYLIAPVAYGALWYSDTDAGWEILKSLCSHENVRNANLAKSFVALGRPVSGQHNPLPKGVRMSPTMKAGFTDELFAYWMVFGDRPSVVALLESMNKETAKRCIVICTSKSSEEISTYYNTVLQSVERYDEAILVGGMTYDTKLLEMAKSILFPVSSSE